MSGFNFGFGTKNYDEKGIKNKKMNNKFIKICKLDKVSLKRYLEKELSKYYKNVIAQDGFLYVKGKDKICLTAHMDTVHIENVIDYYVLKEDGKTIVSSPQGIGGDDRCGVYMILKILETTKLRPTIIFCEDEEVGGIGSNKFVLTKFIKDLEKMYFLIELDRKGSNDLVYYSDINEDFHTYLEDLTGYEQNFGSFSDISHLSPACEISSVNISCGYYNAHTTSEYVVMEEMENSIQTTIKIMKDGLKRKEQFKYKKKEYTYNRNYSDGYEYYSTLFENYSKNFRGIEDEDDEKKVTLYIQFYSGGKEEEEYYEGTNEDTLWTKFFMEHSDVCFNDVIDYDVYDEDDLDYYFGNDKRNMI
jgi:hypothetical protein